MATAEEVILKLTQQVSGPASEANSALAKLEAQIQREVEALGSLELKAMDAAERLATLGEGVDGSVNIAAFNRQRAALDALADQAGKTRKDISTLEGGRGLAKQVDAIGKSSKRSSFDMKGLSRDIDVLPGPIGQASKSFLKIGDDIKGVVEVLGPWGAAAAATAAIVVALTVAIVAATVAILKWSIGLADAARNDALLTESAMANGKALGALADILPGIQERTGLASEQILKLASELDAAGVSAKALPGALKAIAIATAGGADAKFLAKLKAGLLATGKVPPQLAAQFAKFEAIARKKMLSLDAQSATFGRHLGDIFGGLKIDALLEGLAVLVALFDQNTVSGKALKWIFESMFQPLIDGMAKAVPYIERGFIVLLTWALKAYVAVKQFFSTPGGEALLTTLKVVAVLIGVVVGIVVAGLALLVAIPLAIIAAILAVSAAIWAVISTVVSAVEWVVDAVGGVGNALMIVAAIAALPFTIIAAAVAAVFALLSSVDLGSMGTDMIMGLVNGITGAAGAVVGAITGAVGGAIDSAKALLGIHSPSTLLAKQIGMPMGQGVAVGVDKAAPDVQGSLNAAVAPPDLPSAQGSGGRGAGASFVFTNCVFGEGTSEEKLREWLGRMISEMRYDAEPAHG